jgi:sterol desaturase/sphingolipid hydroxylase (fatty acid hydroxylase superfamily)
MPSLAVDFLRLTLWLVLLGIVFVPLEKLLPLHRQKLLRRSLGLDFVYYFLSGIAPKLLLILPISALASVVHNILPGGFYSWMASQPQGLRLAAAVVAGEFGAYWGHRWSHEIPWLWRFHSLHHRAEEMDWLVNTRAHPLDMAFTRFCGLVPMYLLGLAQPRGGELDWVPLAVSLIGTFWGFFIHANVNLRLGWLESLVSSPAFHHWHHTNDSAETLNKNYAALLPWMDRCFGTHYLPAKAWPQIYGIAPLPPESLRSRIVETPTT